MSTEPTDTDFAAAVAAQEAKTESRNAAAQEAHAAQVGNDPGADITEQVEDFWNRAADAFDEPLPPEPGDEPPSESVTAEEAEAAGVVVAGAPTIRRVEGQVYVEAGDIVLEWRAGEQYREHVITGRDGLAISDLVKCVHATIGGIAKVERRGAVVHVTIPEATADLSRAAHTAVAAMIDLHCADRT